MKNIIKSMALIAAAAFTLFACTREEAPESRVPSDEPITLKFNIKNADKAAVSKAILGTTTIQGNTYNFLDWENGDRIGTFSLGSFTSGTESKNNPGTVEVDGSGNTTLNVQVFNAGDITNIYSYFPYSASAGKEKTAAVVTIPESQTMSASGFDADAMPMVGEPKTVDLSGVNANEDTPCGDIRFSNLGSIINFKVYSSTATDETITSVKYVTGGNIGGTFSIDLTSVNFTDDATLALTAAHPVSEITTSYSSHPTIPTGKANAIDVFMVVAPGTYASTQVVVTTNAYKYTLNASNAKTFARSHVKPMNIDIQAGERSALDPVETWTKVTSASGFTAGTYYILNWDESKYLPNIEAGNAPSANAFTGTVTSDMRWEATSSDGGLIFKNPSEELYLWGRDDNNNGVRVKATAPAGSSVKVWKFTNNGDFGVIASVGETRYLATYNNSGTQQDWRNYALTSLGDGSNVPGAGQTTYQVNNFPAVFYKLDENDTRDEAEIAWKKGGVAAATDTASIEDSDDVLPTIALDNPHSLPVTYSSSNPAVATIVESGVGAGTITLVSAGETVISAIFAGNGDYKPSTVSYTLTVTDNTVSYAFTTVAELNALVTSTSTAYYGYLTNAVVSFVPAANTAIVKDATGSVMFYKSSHGLKQGQTYSGAINVTAIQYNSLYSEITAWDVSFAGSETTVAPESVALSTLIGHYSEYQNAYVEIVGLSVTSVDNKDIHVSDGVNSYLVYDNPGMATCIVGDVITVKGTVSKHGSTEQIKVWSASDITITSFAPRSITFSQPTGSAGDAGCSFIVSVGGTPISSGATVASGTTVTLTATAGTGYEFSSWTVNGATVENTSASPTSFVMNTSAVTVSANFSSTGGTPVDVTGPWATWGSTSAFSVSSNTVNSKVSSDFCSTNATLRAYNSSDTQQTVTAGSAGSPASFFFAYFNAAAGSYWQIDLPVTEDIPAGTTISLSYYHAVNSKGITSWTVECDGNALGGAVTINTNGSPASLSDMTHVEKSYTTTSKITSGSTITFKIIAGSGTAKNNRITNIAVSASN